jgi:hypothetical protein
MLDNDGAQENPMCMRIVPLALLALVPPPLAQCPLELSNPFPGLNGTVRALSTGDPDAGGTLGPSLIAGGAFTGTTDGSQDYIAFWNGVAWQALGWGTDGPVNAITTWQTSSVSGYPAHIVIGGEFPHVGSDSTGEVLANGIARWDGISWRTLGGGFDGPVYALASWDPDGPAGPQLPLLIAGGDFRHAGTEAIDYIAAWDGTAWHSLGWGTDGPVRSLTTWDPDGGGPLIEQLVAGGDFTHVGADATGEVGPCSVARWNGSVWASMAGLPGATCFTRFDIGGTSRLVAGGSAGVNYWDGAAWQSLGFTFAYSGTTCDPFQPGMRHPVNGTAAANATALTTWDPDGGGPETRQLYATGAYSYHIPAGSNYDGCSDRDYTVSVLARWDGAQFQPVSSSFAFAEFQPPGMQAMTTIDPNGPGPAHTILAVGGALSAHVFAASADCHCNPDFNHDGDAATDADIEAFFACMAGNCCAACDSADYNGDGDAGTDSDIESFFRVLSGGNC